MPNIDKPTNNFENQKDYSFLGKEKLKELELWIKLSQLEKSTINTYLEKNYPLYKKDFEKLTDEEKKGYAILLKEWEKILWKKEMENLVNTLPLKEVGLFLYELLKVEKEKDLLQTVTIILTQDELKELKTLLTEKATNNKLKKLKEFIEKQLNENITSGELIKNTTLEKKLKQENIKSTEFMNNIDEVWYSMLSSEVKNISKDTLRNIATGITLSLIKIFNKAWWQFDFSWIKDVSKLEKIIIWNISALNRIKNFISILKELKFNNPEDSKKNKLLNNPELFSQLFIKTITNWLTKKQIKEEIQKHQEMENIKLEKEKLKKQLENVFNTAGKYIKKEQINQLNAVSDIWWAIKWMKNYIENVKKTYQDIAIKNADKIIWIKNMLESIGLWKFIKWIINTILKLLGFKNWWESFEEKVKEKYKYIVEWFKNITLSKKIEKTIFSEIIKWNKKIQVNWSLSTNVLKQIENDCVKKENIENYLLNLLWKEKFSAILKTLWIKKEDFLKKIIERKNIKREEVFVINLNELDKVLEQYYQLLSNQKNLIHAKQETIKKEFKEFKEDTKNKEKLTLIKAIKEISKQTQVPEDIIYAIWRNESSLAPLGSNVKRFEKHVYLKYLKNWTDEKNTRKLATSYWVFQIMWFNYKLAWYNSVHEFVEAMKTPEWQMKAFINFVNNNPSLKEAMINRDFHKIARLYNWPNYKKNRYAKKLIAGSKQYLNKNNLAA